MQIIINGKQMEVTPRKTSTYRESGKYSASSCFVDEETLVEVTVTRADA